MRSVRSETLLFALAGALILSACARPTPCAGDGCLPIAGNYIFKLDPTVNCQVWEATSAISPSSQMQVTQLGSQITVTLWPTTGNPTHNFSGTLYADGTIQASESEQNIILGVPYGTLSGAFVSSSSVKDQAPFYFNGTLLLQGAASSPATGHGTTPAGPPQGQTATGCTGETALTAQEQGFSNSTVPVGDGGTATGDGGTASTDGGA